MRFPLLAAAIAIFAAPAMAVTLDDRQPLSGGNQTTVFNFSPVPPNAGRGGILRLGFKGDYTHFTQFTGSSEFATLTFDGVAGSVDIFNGQVRNNTMLGLRLLSIGSDLVDDHDTRFNAVFRVSKPLLDNILGGGSVSATLDNSSDVDCCFNLTDFNSFKLTYKTAAVPVPAALPLLAGGLAAMGVVGLRRRG